MKREAELVRIYADDVLKACVYYLDDRNDAQKAFHETFELAIKRKLFDNERDLRVNLFRTVREVCGSLYFPDDGEEWLYCDYFNLSKEEAFAILGRTSKRKIALSFSS